MFTGIIEEIGIIEDVVNSGKNKHFTIQTQMAANVRIDESIAHNGVCLTVVNQTDSNYQVTAIEETIEKTNFNQLRIGDKLNLERALRLTDRLGGHIVQGHVDVTATCKQIIEGEGSHIFKFSFDKEFSKYLVKKGSICVNGVSLTLLNLSSNWFEVAIIPYTFKHTTFSDLRKNSEVNIEFDIIGKYVHKLLEPSSV